MPAKAVGKITNPFRTSLSFRRRPESRRVGREVKGWQVLSDGALSGRACDCHSRCAGMNSLNHWIPAFAGMTANELLGHNSGSRLFDTLASPTHKPVSSFQRKLESRQGRPAGEGMAGFVGRRIRWTCLWLSFPLCGNGLSQPLDSGLRRAATGILPSRRIQDFLSINDGEGIDASRRPPRRHSPAPAPL